METLVFKIKQGDRLPKFTATISDANGAVNLTGCTVKFIVGSILNATMTVTNALTGAVEYAWANNDTATPGFYSAEIEVTFEDGKKMTFPNDSYVAVHILSDLSPAT